MSATRNPYYQLPGGADLPGDVRVSDTADASKTAADGWAASPAAVASAAATLSSLVCRFDIGDNSVHFQFTPTFGKRASFVLISIMQGSGICCNSLVVHNDDGTNACTEFVSKGLSVNKIATSKSGDIIDVSISYVYNSVWGHLFVFPSDNITNIGQ
jgi:hypothetical protein